MEKELKKQEFFPLNSYKFKIIRPGGNDTALVYGLVENPLERKKINDEIMAMYPNVEQVGFVNLGDKEATLAMAGGEFCGNASRSTAFLALDGQPGEISLTVSGVSRPIRAGVKENGDAFAEMPIYEDPKKVKKLREDRNTWLVEMEGITHLVVFDMEQIENLSKEKIKEQAMKLIEEKGLTRYPAAGVIYTGKSNDGYSIAPVVYVRDINTLFYETACGSGTTALGLVLAKKRGRSIKNVPILQPSGMTINISVDYEDNRFIDAEINGPLQVLGEGSLEATQKGNIFIESVTNQNQLDNILKGGLIKLYQDVFSQPPYNEQFSEEEIVSIFQEYLKQGKLFIARNKTDGVIGFGATLPLDIVPNVKIIAKDNGLRIKNAWYMAELGVMSTYRRLGLGKKLVIARLRAIQAQGGRMALMRTSVNNIVSQRLYTNLGFEVVEGMRQQVEQRRTDGKVVADERIFMIKEL